jgi:hypothetical protein
VVHEIKYRWGAMGRAARRIGFGVLKRKAIRLQTDATDLFGADLVGAQFRYFDTTSSRDWAKFSERTPSLAASPPR